MANQVNDETGAPTRKIKWNDIRIIGPVLVLVLAGALMINPSFVSSANSVGGDGCQNFGVLNVEPCCSEQGVGFVIDPCNTPTPTATAVPPTATAVPPTATAVPPTATVVATAVAPSAPRVLRIPPTPAVIVGPTWLGPITVSESNGIVTLRFPILLSVFVGDGEVTVSSGGLIYRGPLHSNRQISFPASTSGDTSFTIQTVLINDAGYTEVVTLAVAPS